MKQVSAVYQGKAISPGVAMGHIAVMRKRTLVIPDYVPEELEAEKTRFRVAHAAAVEETKALLESTKASNGAGQAEILDAQLTLLQDEYSVVEPILEKIGDERCNAAHAADSVLSEIAAMFAQADDEYLSQRAADVKDIRERLLLHILEQERVHFDALPEDTILVAAELTPSDTIRLDLRHIAGIATETGGYYSHTGIITRNLGIPAVSGLEFDLDAIEDGTCAIVDGETGRFTLSPSEAERQVFLREREELARVVSNLEQYRTRKSCTADGVEGCICANIGTPADAMDAMQKGAEGIGLMRSEFLYMDHEGLPDEETQFAAYREVLETMAGRPVIVRTLDIGGDKDLPALALPKEDNPFLGFRAIRLCLQRKDLFRVQLRALLRASVYGNLHIMFPMISSLEELREAKAMLAQAREELLAEGVCVAPVKVGIMIEIPSAALLADCLAKEVDFFSIGTNDLIQYTLAAERGNASVEYLYTPYQPAVLRLIAMAAKAAEDNGIFCGMCGEAAADPALLPVFWGMGIHELSMSASSVTRARKTLAACHDGACRELVHKVLACTSSEQVKQILN